MTWEYTILTLTGSLPMDTKELDEYGVEGWELVSVAVYDGSLLAYLKRPLDVESD